MQHRTQGSRIMITGALIREHHVVAHRHRHEVVAPRGREQQREVLAVVLVGARVIRITSVGTVRHAEKLAHQMVL